MPVTVVKVMATEAVCPHPDHPQVISPIPDVNVPGAEGRGIAKRRLSAVSLPPLTIPGGVSPTATLHISPAALLSSGNSPYNPRSEESDVVREGRELFGNFVKEEMKIEGLDVTKEVEKCFSPSYSTPVGCRHSAWAKAGKELREMADAFSRTKERQRVKKRAQDIEVNEITFDQFQDLLSELFHCNTITRERIVVLFFFCSDLAIRTFRLQMNYFEKFIQWSLKYIAERVCEWVKGRGGWSVVLGSSLQSFKQLGIFTALAVASICFIRYIRHQS
ncbi:uncharacterized protein LOC135482785 [Lineus longissimus]|uniref:uncharacterized protein LOC135482785 n=1 Tax=Lineus longissimus TaxID=88925 RepID=UPI00315DA478